MYLPLNSVGETTTTLQPLKNYKTFAIVPLMELHFVISKHIIEFHNCWWCFKYIKHLWTVNFYKKSPFFKLLRNVIGDLSVLVLEKEISFDLLSGWNEPRSVKHILAGTIFFSNGLFWIPVVLWLLYIKFAL